MVQKVQVLLVDDIDGGEATETISFGLDNTQYEIDLSEKNAAMLREALARFVPPARRVGGRVRPVPASTHGRRAPAPAAPVASHNGAREEPEASPRAIRTWAAENGVKVSDRGRIPAEVVAQFRAAQG